MQKHKSVCFCLKLVSISTSPGGMILLVELYGQSKMLALHIQNIIPWQAGAHYISAVSALVITLRS